MTGFHPLAILAALGGRYQWRWWGAVAVWLLVALAAYPVLSLQGERYSTFPALVMAVATLLSLPVIWVWGSRFALSLGHRRGHVFVVTVLASAAFPWALYLVHMAVRRVEFLLAGTGGMRVFLTSFPESKFYTERFFDSFWQVLMLYAIPFVMAGAVIVACAMRWKVLGALGSVVGVAAVGLLLPLIGTILMAVLDVAYLPGYTLYLGIAAWCVVTAGTAWLAFREQPV